MHIFTKRLTRSIFFMLTLLIITNNIYAQVPANDDPCGAITLIPSAGCSYATFTNVDASNSNGPGVPNPTPGVLCGNFQDADVWFTTTVPVGATSVVIDTKNLTLTNGAMTVYTATGTCPSLNLAQVDCDDDASLNPSMPKLTITRPAGTVLYIRMYGFGAEMGTFGICVTAAVPPINDDCANAVSLTVNPDYNCGVVSTGNTTINATQSPNTPSPLCNSTGINDDVWFSFTATGPDHRISFLNILPAASTMNFQVYRGTCTALVRVYCNTTNSADLTGLTAGTTYLVRAFTSSSNGSVRATSFDACVGTLPPPPANDECVAATSLTVNPTLTCTAVATGTTQSATPTVGAPAPSCAAGGENDDVWYSFIATSTSHRITLSNIIPSVTGMATAVYSGATCATLTEIACNTTSVFQVNGLTLGNVYYVRVFTSSSLTSDVANFSICVATPPPSPANDECLGAINLTVNPDYLCGVTTMGTTVSATPSSTAPTPSCGVANAFNDDVWYSFTATSTRHRVVLSAIVGFTNLTTVVYSGTCGALTEITCRNTNTYDVTGLTIGNTYYIRVFTNTAVVTSEVTSFTLCIGSPPPPPVNDNCTSAINLIVNADLLCGVFGQATITSATPSGTLPFPSCAPTGVDDDVWFSFTATNSIHQINVFNILPVTTMAVAVYSGTCAGLTEIACNQTNLFNLTGLIIGNVYYLRVYSIGITANLEIDFRICVGTPPPPPANDDCLNAVSLTVNPNFTCTSFAIGTTVSAQQSNTLPIPSCAPANSWNDDVWYKFIASANIERITVNNITGAATDLITTVYSGNCGALTEIACSDPEVFNVAGLVVGNTYYVRVFTKTTSLITFANSFNICVSNLPPPPPNDNCTGAINLTVNNNLTCAASIAGTTVGATLSTTLPTPTCATANSWNDDVWYSFIATNTSHRVTLLNVTGLTTDMVSAVYSGICGSLTQLICSFANPNTYDVGNLVVGNTYYVRVLTANVTPEDASFSICIGSPAPNRTCETAIPFCNQISDEVNYPSTQGSQFITTIPPTPSGAISCLSTTPNRNWFDIVVVTAGPIFIEISQIGGNVSNDVDFAAWGPFTSPAAACGAINVSPGNTILNIPSGVPTAASTQGGCSYSPNAVEYFKIPNALPGQVYKLLVTNFSESDNNLPPFTTPSQFVKLKSMIPVSSGGASLDCNLTCFSATATNTGPVCPGGTFNLVATGSSTPFAWTGPSGFTSSIQNPTGIVASTTPGNYIYTVTVGTGTSACVKSTTVVVTAPPPIPVVSATPLLYCEGATASLLTATALSGNILQWYTNATGGTATTTLTPFTTTAFVGSTIYYVSQKAGSCEGPRASIIVNVTAKPLVPTVVNPAAFCQGATALALTATAATGNTLLYYTTAIGGTGVTTLTPSTTASGTFTYYVSQVTSVLTGSCEGPRAPIIVTVNPKPAAPTTVGLTLTYCEGATIPTLTAGGLATGATLLWYTNATGGIGSSTAPIPSNTANSTYYVSQILNGCESSTRTAITTTITSKPLAPVVSAIPVLYCQGATAAALTATALPSNTLMWYSVATGGTGTTTFTPPTTAAGSITYYVSQQTSNNCESPRASVIVTVIAKPLAPTAIDPVPYCQGVTAAALTATAATGNSLLYYTTATGGVGATTLTPSTTASGTFTYYVSQVTSGSCEGPRTPILITVNPTPAPPVPTVVAAYCQGATTVPLTANGITTGATLLWYTALTGGVAIATPTPSNTATSTYYVTQILNGCESSPRVTLTTTITPTPNAPTVVAVSPLYCQGATGVAALTATTTSGNTLLWYTTPSLGTGTSTLMPNTNLTTIYYVSQQTVNNCEGPRTALTVIITPTPALPTVVNPTPYCEGATAAPLTATATAGNSLLYYTSLIGGIGLATLTPSTTTAGTFTFYVSQKTTTALGACEGPRTPIVVTIKPTPAPPVPLTPAPYCQAEITAPLTATTLSGANLLWYSALTGGTAIATPTPSNTANSTYYVTQILNGCESSPRVALTTTITPTPAKPVVTALVKYCPGDVANPLSTSATALASNSLVYYTTATGGVGSSTPIIPSTSIIGNFNYYVSQVTAAAIGGCEGPRALITVSISNNNLFAYIGKDTTICQGGSASFMPTVTPVPNTFSWRVKTLGISSNTINNAISKDIILSPIDTAEYILKATLGGCSVEDTVKVNVIWKPIITTKGNFAICNNTSTILSGIISHNSSNNIDYVWSPKDSLSTPDTIQTIAKPILSTRYKITYTTQASYGCSFTDSTSMKLVIQPVVKAFAGNDTTAVKSVPHQLHGKGGLNYSWYNPSGAFITGAFNQNAYVTLNNDANFYLKVTDAIGCEGRDSIFVKVYEGPSYYVPNTFTPNGDGVNDVFRAIPVGISNTVYFRVFNRYGELMFETNLWLKGWDGTYKGKPQPSGTYVWIVKGTDRDYKKVEMKGTVNIVR